MLLHLSAAIFDGKVVAEKSPNFRTKITCPTTSTRSTSRLPVLDLEPHKLASFLIF